MTNWRQITLLPNASLGDAIAAIDKGALQIALVADPAGKLVGTVTDGDVRRAMLRGASMGTSLSEVMNSQPHTMSVGASRRDVRAFITRHGIHQVPIVNGMGVLVGLEHIDALLTAEDRPNWVVLMAGGMGKRLMPLTEHIPKPMLPLGGRPVLETILEGFLDQGFSRFFLSVNYMAEAIHDHFGDGERWGVQIEYLREDKPLGTAGALSLLPEKPSHPIIVMNGDLLTRADFNRVLAHHQVENSVATMVVREYEHQIPYGVVHTEGSRISSLSEKPVHRCFINAGMYVLSPAALRVVPQDTFFDMPSLFSALVEKGDPASVYPLRDYWLDIGRLEEFERAQREWQ